MRQKKQLRVHLYAVVLIGCLLVPLRSIRFLYTLGTEDQLFHGRLEALSIQVDSADASPEEIERRITVPIEEECGSLSSLKEVQSISGNGESRVFLLFHEGTDMDTAYLETREAVERIQPFFPQKAGIARIHTYDMRNIPVFCASFPLDTDRAMLKQRLSRIDGVGSVAVTGFNDEEFCVELEVPPKGVSRSDVAFTVSKSSYGTEFRIQDRRVSVDARPRSAASIGALNLKNGLEVSDTAAVALKEREPDAVARMNGVPRIIATVQASSDAYPIRLCKACSEAIQDFPGSEEVYNAGSEAQSSLIRITVTVAFSFLLMMIAVHDKASVLRIMGGTLFSVLSGCSGLTLLGKPLTPTNLSSLAAGGVLAARSLSLVKQREGRKPSGIRSVPGLMIAFLLSVSAILLALLGKGEIALSLILPQIIALVATYFYGRLFERNRTETWLSAGNTWAHVPFKTSHALLINLICLAALVFSLVASQHLALDDRANGLSFSVEFESGLRLDEVEKRIRSFERWLSEREEVTYVASVCEDERARFDIRLEKRGVAENLYKECTSRSIEIQDGFLHREEEGSSKSIDIVVTGSVREGLRDTAGELGAALSRLDGVNEVVYRFKERKPVVSIELSPSRLSAFGLTVQEAAREIILASEGRVVSKVIGDREELDVRIVPSDTPRTLSSLGDTLIYPDGRELCLKDIARFSLEENYGPMYRFQKKRCVFFTVTSNLNSSGAARNLEQDIQGILDSHPYREGIRASIVEEESGQDLLPVILAALSLCAAMCACTKAFSRARKIFLHGVLSAALPSLLALYEPLGIAGGAGTLTAIFCAVESTDLRRETQMSGGFYSGTEAIASCGIIPLILCIPEMRPFFSCLLSGLIGFRLFAALRGSIRHSCKKRRDL